MFNSPHRKGTPQPPLARGHQLSGAQAGAPSLPPPQAGPGTVQNENARPLLKPFFRISRQQQRGPMCRTSGETVGRCGTCKPISVHLWHILYFYFFMFIFCLFIYHLSSPFKCKAHTSRLSYPAYYAEHIVGIQFAATGGQREEGKESRREERGTHPL